jgi:hypothetical protein
MLTPSRTSKLLMNLIESFIKFWWEVASLIAHFNFFAECIFCEWPNQTGSFDSENVDEEGIFYYRDNISSNE